MTVLRAGLKRVELQIQRRRKQVSNLYASQRHIILVE